MRRITLFPILMILAVLSLAVAACGSDAEVPPTAPSAAVDATAPPARVADTPVPSFDAAAYFKGKTIRIYANFAPGGGADLNARVIARNLGDFVPGNPRVIVVSKHGAAGMIGGNFVYRAKPDGLHMGVSPE